MFSYIFFFISSDLTGSTKSTVYKIDIYVILPQYLQDKALSLYLYVYVWYCYLNRFVAIQAYLADTILAHNY